MNGLVKIIGTNDATKDLQNKIFENSSLKNEGAVHYLLLNEGKYLLDFKEVRVKKDHLLIFGVISNNASWVGNIALEFYPKSLDKDRKST